MKIKEVQVYSPATIANVSCGFDVLGLALNEPVDKMVLRKSHFPGVRLNIKGADLPKEPKRNIVGVVLEEMLDHLPNNKYGIEVEIYKKIKPGSGLGSSAASAAGSAVGANRLFGNYFNTSDLISFALIGEELASGSKHADNVAPAILGGFTLVKNNPKLEVVSLPSPKKLWVSIIHPQIELKTSEARTILKKEVLMNDAISQLENVGAFVAALYKKDYTLLGKALEDYLVEPQRAYSIPALKELKIECKKIGALGGGISGSGPSVFMLSESKDKAYRIVDCMNYICKKFKYNYKLYVTTINNHGIKTVLTF